MTDEIKYWCTLCNIDNFPKRVRIDRSPPDQLPWCEEHKFAMNFFTLPEDELEFYSIRYAKPENKIKRFFKSFWLWG